jgi:hypothetical protein
MSSSPLKKAGAVTSGQLKQNLNPQSPGNPNNPGPVLDVDSNEVMRQYEPQRALPLPGENIVISPIELIAESVEETSLVPAAETDSVLLRLDEAQRALAEATSIQEVKQIVDVAEAARVYLKRAKQSAQTIYAATSLRIWAERRLGEKLIEAKKKGELDEGKGGDRKSPSSTSRVILADLGITYDESARAQKLAIVPLAEFEKRMATCQDGGARSISLILREIDVHQARKPQKSSSDAKAKSRSPKRSKSPAAATANELQVKPEATPKPGEPVSAGADTKPVAADTPEPPPQVKPEATAKLGEPVSAGADTKPVAADTPEPPLLQITTALAPPGACRKVFLAENLVPASWELEAVIQNRIRPVLEQLKSETVLPSRDKLMKRLGAVEKVLTVTLERLRECAKLAPLTSRMADDEDEAREDKDQ